ncbi:putative hydrolase [Pseudomonas aeruginosa]|nr:putative hydrolase [Pseudomonas aeruginosa]
MNPPQPRLIDNGNGHPLASHWYRPAGEPRGYLLIVPAMGVEQRFYAPFAAWLAERGYLAITFDYLGMGAIAQRLAARSRGRCAGLGPS